MSENKEEIKTEISADNTASEYEVIISPSLMEQNGNLPLWIPLKWKARTIWQYL